LKTVPRELVAAQLLSVEYSPYHSERFGHHPMLPSQEYGFHLVRQAVLRNAVVVVMRSLKLWQAAVPELIGYHRAFTLRSVQNVAISPGNCPDGFGLLIEAFRQYEMRYAAG
jgi:hypothetical protein